MNIADLFFRAMLDSSDLNKQAQEAGDEAGETMGSRMSRGISTTLKTGLASLAAVGGLATKAMLDLDEATARFAADTGATADEADRARKAINAMAGRNLQPIREIGETLGKVHTDLGLVGDQAESVAEVFLRFARVTKRDAATEVAAFDDVLDAWGGTAEDIPPLMDKLIKSHQDYGGAIHEDISALKLMAPQMKALNLGIDDAIGLLNLFKESGLDAALVPRALTSAIQKLNGESLPDFIKRLSEIEDPGLRAAEAIKVFGSRAGPQLANAIRPGVDSLEDFKISTDEATGSLEDAHKAITGTFSERVQQAIKDVTSKVVEFGGAFGPALTGLASLASLGGALGLDRLIGAIISKFGSAGREAGEAFIDASATAVGALGTVIGNLVANALDPTNPLLGNPIRRVATAAGALWGRIFAIGAKIAEVVTNMLLGLPGVARVVNAIESSALTLGKTWGTKFAVGATIGIALVAPELLNAITPKDAQKIAERYGEDFASTLTTATIDELRAKRAEVARALAEAYAAPSGFDPLRPFKNLFGPDNIFGTTAEQDIRKTLDEIDAAIAAWEAANKPSVEVEVLGPPVPVVDDALAAAGEAGGRIGARMGEMMTKTWAERLVGIGQTARLAGAQASLNLAAGLRSARGNITAALNQLREDMKNKLTPRKEVALRIGQLFSKTLARGLKSADPVIKAQAEGTRALIEDQLIETIKAGGEAGKKIMEELERKLRSKDPKVRDQAKRTKQLVDAALKAQPAKTPGDKIGQDLANDLRSKGPIIGKIAYDIGRSIARNLRAGVQGSGYVAPSSSPTAPRPRGEQEYQHGTPYVPADMMAYLHQGEMVVPARQAAAIRAGNVSSSVGPVYVTLDASGHSNPGAFASAARQAIADGMADALRSQSARLPVGTRA